MGDEHEQTDQPVELENEGAERSGKDTDELREGLAAMREESDRIATLETGTEQVEAAEQFAEDAGRLDEQIGSAARAAEDHDSRG